MTETREAFRARVRAWLNANAPRKGEPGDFSAAHLVSAGTPEDHRRREREALGVTMAKLLYSEHARRTADDAMRLLGAVGLTSEHPDAAPWAERLLFATGLRLGGGTDEIQRNTIAERGLGLPREVSAAPGQSSEARSVRSKA